MTHIILGLLQALADPLCTLPHNILCLTGISLRRVLDSVRGMAILGLVSRRRGFHVRVIAFFAFLGLLQALADPLCTLPHNILCRTDASLQHILDSVWEMTHIIPGLLQALAD